MVFCSLILLLETHMLFLSKSEMLVAAGFASWRVSYCTYGVAHLATRIKTAVNVSFGLDFKPKNSVK